VHRRSWIWGCIKVIAFLTHENMGLVSEITCLLFKLQHICWCSIMATRRSSWIWWSHEIRNQFWHLHCISYIKNGRPDMTGFFVASRRMSVEISVLIGLFLPPLNCTGSQTSICDNIVMYRGLPVGPINQFNIVVCIENHHSCIELACLKLQQHLDNPQRRQNKMYEWCLKKLFSYSCSAQVHWEKNQV